MNKLIWFYRRIDQNRNEFELRFPTFAAITSDCVRWWAAMVLPFREFASRTMTAMACQTEPILCVQIFTSCACARVFV